MRAGPLGRYWVSPPLGGLTIEVMEKPEEWGPLDGIGTLGLFIDALVTADVTSDDIDIWLGCRR